MMRVLFQALLALALVFGSAAACPTSKDIADYLSQLKELGPRSKMDSYEVIKTNGKVPIGSFAPLAKEITQDKLYPLMSLRKHYFDEFSAICAYQISTNGSVLVFGQPKAR
jgi:hypothetical protein